MEMFSKLESVISKLDSKDDSRSHAELLKTIVHYMQGCLHWIIEDNQQALHELQVREHVQLS